MGNRKLVLGWVRVCLPFVLVAAPVPAAVRFVSGSCPTSGTGAQAACGTAGPFRTIGEGVLAMQPGDTLNVRAGTYFEQITLSSGSNQPGKALTCTAAAPCVIQGCRAPACATDEFPVVRGMRTRADWVDVGGGVYRRTMEATPELVSSGDERNSRPGDPLMVMQGTASPMTMLAYAGDDVTTPADGQWSFHPTRGWVYVNPSGTADPAAVIQLPHFSYGLLAQEPTAYVTVAHLALEGTRLVGAQWTGTPPDGMPGIQMRDVQVRYFPRQGIRTTNGVPGLVLEDVLVEYGCRGISWALATGDGCFGLRLFQIHGGLVRRAVVRHLGSTGQRRLSAPSDPNGWECSWCDAPWNAVQYTRISTSGVGVNVKQTDTAIVEDVQAEDLSLGAVFVDVSRHVTVRRAQTRRTASGLSQSNFTPVDGYTVSYDNFFQDSRIEDAECGVTISDTTTPGRPAGSLLATVERNTFARVPTAVCAPSPLPADLIVRGNVIDGGTVTTSTTAPSTTLVSTTSTSSSSSTSSTGPSTTSTRPPSTTSSSTSSSTSSTTSSSTSSTSTVTTLPGFERYLEGDTLLLQGHSTALASRRLDLQSVDRAALIVGNGGNPGPLISSGGELRVTAIGGDGFAAVYPLPARRWGLLDPLHPSAGVRYRDAVGPISEIVLDAGTSLTITGGGSRLMQTLRTEPQLVEVDLRLGRYHYCLEFGGSIRSFIADLMFSRRYAPRPKRCGTAAALSLGGG